MLNMRHFSGGVHPKGMKSTHFSPTVTLDSFTTVRIPMSMHVGPPCTCVVKPGDAVRVGQLIGRADAPMAVPIHASVSGVVKEVLKEVASGGRSVEVVVITSDGRNEVFEGLQPPMVGNRAEFVQAVRDSGLVGLGGAGFPTYVKMQPPPGKEPDTLLINAAECEPYVTSDFRQCVEHPAEIIDGIRLVMKYMDIPRALIGVEKNKPLAIKMLNAELQKQNSGSAAQPDIQVVGLHTIYPQGAEKMLIYALTRRKVPTGGLPHDVHVMMLNVSTVEYIAEYLKTGMPLVRRRLTLAGDAIRQPGNFNVPVGAPIPELIELAGGTTVPIGKVIMGGPMMGVALDRVEASVIKMNNALLVFSEKQGATPLETQCIRCARCVEVCPMNLMPTYIDNMARNQDVPKLIALNVNDCIECGCCTYICPAKRYLVQSIRNGKTYVRLASIKAKEDAKV